MGNVPYYLVKTGLSTISSATSIFIFASSSLVLSHLHMTISHLLWNFRNYLSITALCQQTYVSQALYQTLYPASRGYIFAVWAGVQKVASADNRSIFYRACAKFVTRFGSNWFVKSAWVSRENYLRTTLLELVFCFSASPLLVLTILAAKFPRIVFFRKVFLCYQL